MSKNKINTIPLFSIITVCYNAAGTIIETINSVLNQNFLNYEYLIIDGGSTDGTSDIINQFNSEKIILVTEPDQGIYDAMNKGILLSRGEYIYFLGANDILMNNTVLSTVNDCFIDNKFDIVYGDVVYDTGVQFKSDFNFKTLLNNTIHHQSAFYKRNLFDDFKYDLNFKIVADFELNLKLYLSRRNISMRKIDTVISRCSEGGISRLKVKQAFSETNAIRAKVLGRKALHLKWLYMVKFYLTTYAI